MITLTQDTDGFIRMDRHLPGSLPVTVAFADGTSEVLTGAVLNKAYDDAVAVFRAKNHLDAKGFSRVRKMPANAKISDVPVSPGMGR
ncbi:hypothetical protein [Arthrobacter yangruifuii]|uniref:Uncharacterized protein n=1 Tax=Arthrobacter yangruifuii TaxID=2606616 RepID=A0A5N6MTJ7_9MICC|nr:hypothetical protein [Arthrobacter yangruifuii]KAD4060143.1 hypothetical protein GD627_03540 [Arthrobacter yangruifuii]